MAGYFLLAFAVTATLRGPSAPVVLGLAGIKLGAYVTWTTVRHEFY